MAADGRPAPNAAAVDERHVGQGPHADLRHPLRQAGRIQLQLHTSGRILHRRPGRRGQKYADRARRSHRLQRQSGCEPAYGRQHRQRLCAEQFVARNVHENKHFQTRKQQTARHRQQLPGSRKGANHHPTADERTRRDLRHRKNDVAPERQARHPDPVDITREMRFNRPGHIRPLGTPGHPAPAVAPKERFGTG